MEQLRLLITRDPIHDRSAVLGGSLFQQIRFDNNVLYNRKNFILRKLNKTGGVVGVADFPNLPSSGNLKPGVQKPPPIGLMSGKQGLQM